MNNEMVAETPEPPTEVVVAAANSRSFEKKATDLVCTGSNGVYSLPGSNDESARNRYNKVCVGGLHTGFDFNASARLGRC